MRLKDDDGELVATDYGWSIASVTPPERHDLFWTHLPTKDVYTHDGDGWYRILPNDRKRWGS